MEEVSERLDGRDALTHRASEPVVEVDAFGGRLAVEHADDALHVGTRARQVRPRAASIERALILFLIIVVIV